ncbi:unnamed protein product, partial [Iphiclides podalirius]
MRMAYVTEREAATFADGCRDSNSRYRLTDGKEGNRSALRTGRRPREAAPCKCTSQGVRPTYHSATTARSRHLLSCTALRPYFQWLSRKRPSVVAPPMRTQCCLLRADKVHFPVRRAPTNRDAGANAILLSLIAALYESC